MKCMLVKTACLALSFMILFLSCATIQPDTRPTLSEVCKTWIGGQAGDLMRSWGPPTTVIDDGEGGRIMTWKHDKNIMYTGPFIFGIYRTTAITKESYVSMWARPEGTIYFWKTNIPDEFRAKSGRGLHPAVATAGIGAVLFFGWILATKANN